jgi:hypothetical protein
MRIGTLSLEVKWPGREADHLLPSSAEVKNTWSYTSTPPIRLHGVVLSSAQRQLYLYFNFYLSLFVISDNGRERKCIFLQYETD